MKLENYRSKDIYEVIERKNLMVHQMDKLDANFWTDDIQKAKQNIVDLYKGICELERLQARKKLEDLVGEFEVLGVDVKILGIRKTD